MNAKQQLIDLIERVVPDDATAAEARIVYTAKQEITVLGSAHERYQYRGVVRLEAQNMTPTAVYTDGTRVRGKPLLEVTLETEVLR